MTIRAELHDGRVLEFPDGTSPAVVQSTVKRVLSGGQGSAPAPVRPAPKAPAPRQTPMQQATGFLSKVNRGLGVGDEIAGGINSLIAATQAVRQGKFDQVPNALASGMQRQRAIEDAYQQQHPLMAAGGLGIGNAITAIPTGTGAVPLMGTRAINMARGAVTAGLTGAAYAAADRGNVKERLAAASETARNPFVLGLGAVGGAMAPSLKPPAKPKYDASVRTLREAGVELTHGQMRGGLVKAMEDAGTSLPIVGTAIQEARGAGLETFNHAVANDALRPVGRSVPKNIPAGYETVNYVEKTLGGMYDQVIPSARVVVDKEMQDALATRLGEITPDMTPEARARLGQIIDQRVTSRFRRGPIVPSDTTAAIPGSTAGTVEGVDGKLFQTINSSLGNLKAKFGASSDVDQRTIGEALGIVQEELRNAASRQDPTFAARKGRIDQAYALFKRMQGAAASPGAEGGVFTAGQYGGAVRRGDRSLDKGAMARGEARGQVLADAGRAVLPNKIPDSGTAMRTTLNGAYTSLGAIGGAVLTGHPEAAASIAATLGAGAAGLKLASSLYTPEAIAAANKALDVKLSADQQRVALLQLRRMAVQNPKIQRLYQYVAGALGVTTASAASAKPKDSASPAQ